QPPLTTPVPRNFNETRERLRSILNKKKQKYKNIDESKAPSAESDRPKMQPVHRPPALPKTLPPNLTPQAQQKKQILDNQQKQLADKMAKMSVSDHPEVTKSAAVPSQAGPQTTQPIIATEGKVNPNAMEQIRLQHLKQQQQGQQQHQQQHQAQQQKKPEPIYDLPIHNKPTLTPQQQQQIRQQQMELQHQQHQQMLRQQQAQMHQKQHIHHQHVQPQHVHPRHQQQIEHQQSLIHQRQLHQQHIHQQRMYLQQMAQEQEKQHQQLQQQEQQHQQEQQEQQHQQHERQNRLAQQQLSLSSRDTSVFSTSSECSGGSCWRGRGGCSHRLEDPRDLDALLQYIEGPARHVDRGKKRAKKMRQKAKRMESRLLSEIAALRAESEAAMVTAARKRGCHDGALSMLREARAAMAQLQRAKRKYGKKLKLNPAQQANVQMATERLAELTAFYNNTEKEWEMAQQHDKEVSERLAQLERQLSEVRGVQGKPAPTDSQDKQQLPKTQSEQQRYTETHNNEKKSPAGGVGKALPDLRVSRSIADGSLKVTVNKESKTYSHSINATHHLTVTASSITKTTAAPQVRVSRSTADGSLQVTVTNDSKTYSHAINATHHLTVLNMQGENKQRSTEQRSSTQQQNESNKKQSWEQAIAHMNQLAKGKDKEKKKQKEAAPKKAEPKQKETTPAAAAEEQPLSKKQRKLLAKQQAEEEERKKQQQLEAKTKKQEKKEKEAIKQEAIKKEKKVEQKKEQEAKQKKKETKKQDKIEKNESKEKNASTTKAPPQPQQHQQQSSGNKKEKKKENSQNQKQNVNNITSDTTIEVVNKKSASASETEKPSSCSIMEQLSCGVEVADLKLPPGITLTRVAPSEKREPAPAIKSVPLWKCSSLAATPTPVARPPPVINADPSMMIFTTTQPEPPKPIVVSEPPPAANKSKKGKKKSKKSTETPPEPAPEAPKMVTLRNPMFHPNLPPVQITTVAPPQKKSDIRIPDPIPMPPTPCQATITPTSNGMYTIRNPLMSMMHQQSLMGVRNPTPPVATPYKNYNTQYAPPQTYIVDGAAKPEEPSNRLINLASFTQNSNEGYSLFNTNDSQQKSFITTDFYDNPKVVSPNPIGTRPDANRSDSLFTKTGPEPIGTPFKSYEEKQYAGLYTPFGQEDRNVFRNALFNHSDASGENGDMPYFQQLHAGSKLNSEVSIHCVSDSKYYKGQERYVAPSPGEQSVFSHAGWPPSDMHAHPQGMHNNQVRCGSAGATPLQPHPEGSVFLPDRSITNLSSLDVSEREIESFKRFDFYFEPPQHKPKVQLDVRDIAAALRQNHK
ncbi:unnamed protein product, partial [Leptidea sinapis]